ncbi:MULTISPECIES: late competence development ComFB family protein [Crocosphaera]|uniref:Competence protein ComFB n=2 Tax=Crocosphaera watsonii TaxID=263511 RepID=T2IMU4_CROWT|nr:MULTISPECIES: late competence development ComFB family protein [Crocosphaera]MCH2246253.1 late competence development ComFB family protein [Crocosphaera sp.]NQZ61773.1 late competence development ComFB family protein [Crocosphaera sp.]CCQ54112.1 hypothetical protein CWATWH0005_5503 [Crocosphaera watsonii WH 0005]
MNYSIDSGAKVHVNIMELLVQNEIDKQLRLYPKKIRDYINKVEVATYALNRLPPLYASSLIGKEHQKRTGMQKYKSQITLAVRRSLAAIERDPIKKTVPIRPESYAEHDLAKESLDKLETLFKRQGILGDYQKLSWDNLYRVIYPLIAKLKYETIKRDELEFAALTDVSKQLSEELSQSYNLTQRER